MCSIWPENTYTQKARFWGVFGLKSGFKMIQAKYKKNALEIFTQAIILPSFRKID